MHVKLLLGFTPRTSVEQLSPSLKGKQIFDVLSKNFDFYQIDLFSCEKWNILEFVKLNQITNSFSKLNYEFIKILNFTLKNSSKKAQKLFEIKNMIRYALQFSKGILSAKINKSFNFPRFFSTESNKKEFLPTDFGYFANKLEEISKINSRNGSIRAMEQLIEEYINLGDQEMLIGVMKMLQHKTEIENTQIAEQTIKEIINIVFTGNDMKSFLFETGDIGTYAKLQMERKNIQLQPSDLSNQHRVSLAQTIQLFQEISEMSGTGSRQAKNDRIIEFISLLNDPIEVQYFKCLRIGVNVKSIVKALEAIHKKNPEGCHEELLRRLENEVFKFKTGLLSQSTIGIPIIPMSAKALSSMPEVEKFFTKFTSKKVSFELKYDGERTQIHYCRKSQKINLFSRNLESQNEKNPTLISFLLQYFNEQTNINQCIIDGELIVTDSTGKILSFQDQQNRPRKLADNQIDESFSKVFIFDVMMINSQDLTKRNQSERLDLLSKSFPEKGIIEFVERRILDLDNKEEFNQVEKMLQKYIDNSQEGAMIKSLSPETFYDSVGRTFWAKLKKQVIQGGIADQFDVLPIAAYYGKGKRSGNYGAYLLGCFDPIERKYVALCKIGTGFTDSFMDEATTRLKNNITSKKPVQYSVNRTLKPDVWFSHPSEVWEISADCMTQSPIYSIGTTSDNNKGISLRFPRFHKVRTDKNIDQATTTIDVIEFFGQQEQKKQNSTNDNDDQ